MKPGSARPTVARWAIGIVAAASPLAMLGLAASYAAPAFAEQPATYLAASASAAATAVPGSLVETNALKQPTLTPAYRTIGSGKASYYGRELAGNRTASGERFDPSDLTAAHRTLPLGSKVRITNTRTGDSVIVRINDRGPFHSNRLIDMSEAAARRIGIRATGSGNVDLAVAD
jgi:rare lipoprotein A